jgi:hypothetical protein
MYKNMEMVLNFDWIAIIENEKITLLILFYFFGYMQATKIFNFNMIIWLYYIYIYKVGINIIGFWQNIII